VARAGGIRTVGIRDRQTMAMMEVVRRTENVATKSGGLMAHSKSEYGSARALRPRAKLTKNHITMTKAPVAEMQLVFKCRSTMRWWQGRAGAKACNS
jgi:hypothetical protein